MGILLYPQTSDASVLERLINVPEGTYARLQQLQTAFDDVFGLKKPGGPDYVSNPDSNEVDVEYLLHQVINADLNLVKMKDFLIYGWGKFTLRENDDYVGNIDPVKDAQHMLVSASYGKSLSSHMSPKETVELAGGLCWS